MGKEVYVGSINTFGLDIVAATQGRLGLAMLAWPTAVTAQRRCATTFHYLPPEPLDERIVSFPVSGET